MKKSNSLISSMPQVRFRSEGFRVQKQKGINKYNRFRHLLVGESNDTPGQADPAEVEWVRFISLDELREKQQSGEFTFVEEFFEDTELATKMLPSQRGGHI